MSLTAEQMGLVNPVQSGAVLDSAAPPADVLEAPAFAADEDAVSRIREAEAEGQAPQAAPAPASPASFLSPGTPQVQGQPGTPATPIDASDPAIWENPNNPYKRAVEQARPNRVAQLRNDLQQVPQYTQAAHAQLVAAGYDPEHASQLVSLAARTAQAELTEQINAEISAPAARQMVAEDIAKRVSIPGVSIDPKELLGERSPDAMVARARTLVEVRRTQGATTRAAARVDTVETSSGLTGGTARSGGTLSPFETIKSGLRSGRRN